MRRSLVTTLICILSLFSNYCHAQWTEPVRIFDNPGMSPRAVAVGETLHVAVKTSVWTTYLRSPDNGETWTEPVVPADTFYGGSEMADIAFSNGLLHLAYRGIEEDVPRPQIFVLSSSDGGRSWWRRRRVFHNVSGGLKTPRMAVNGDTLFLSCRSGYIWLFRSLDNGESWSDSVMVESDTLAIIQTQNIEFSDGILHLIMPYGILNNSTGYEVYYRKSTDYGLTWSDRVALSTEERYPNIKDSQSPSAASDADGNVIVTWFDYKYGSACGVSGDILGRVSMDNGDTWLPECRLTYTQTGRKSGSIILNGVIHTAWGDEYPNGCGYPKIMYSESRDCGWSWTEPAVITELENLIEKTPVFVYNVSNGDTILHCFFSGERAGESTYIYHIKKFFRTGIEDSDGIKSIPENIELRAYPNPFNSSAIISFSNLEGGNTKIEIFNLIGQKVRSYNTDKGKEGKILWDARDALGNKVSSGIYFARAKTYNNYTAIKLLYMK